MGDTVATSVDLTPRHHPDDDVANLNMAAIKLALRKLGVAADAAIASATPYDVVKSAAFSGVPSVSASWAAGAYRRLELHLRVTASGAGNVVAAFAGLGGVYSSWSTYNLAGSTAWGGSVFATWTLGNAAYVGQTDAVFQIGAGGLRTFQSQVLDATNSYVLLSQGANTDTASLVSGVTLTFPGATTGWLELLGFA